MEEYAREPCPYRIVDDCGGAFAMGCIGGGVFQAIKGDLSRIIDKIFKEKSK